MAILQGSSTQNDLVASLFIMLFLYFAFLSVRSGGRSDAIFAGLSLGLALLSKGTTPIFCLPIGVLIFGPSLVRELFKERTFKLVGRVAMIVLLAFAINASHYYRNWQLFGVPVTSGEENATNANITLPMIASNVVCNYALHFGSINDSTTKFIEKVIAVALGPELNNPDSTYLAYKIKFEIPQTVNEDNAGNLIHTILLTLACFAAFGCAGEERRTVFITAVSIVGGFVIFCIVLRWQPWASRLHLPLFMIGSPLIAWMAVKIGMRSVAVMAIVVFVACVPALFFGRKYALVFIGDRTRTDKYFSIYPALGAANVDTADFFRKTNVKEIGLNLSSDQEHYKFGDWEYPYWVLIRNNSGEKPLFKHVGVKNVSNRLNDGRPPPEWVISTTTENMIDGTEYMEVFNEPPLRILRRGLMGSEK